MSFEGYTREQVGYHAHLLVDAGFAQGSDITTHGSASPEALITSLTWAGHEFAEAARDDTRWKRAMGIVAQTGGTITLEVLKQLLGTLMKASFGLP